MAPVWVTAAVGPHEFNPATEHGAFEDRHCPLFVFVHQYCETDEQEDVPEAHAVLDWLHEPSEPTHQFDDGAEVVVDVEVHADVACPFTRGQELPLETVATGVVLPAMQHEVCVAGVCVAPVWVTAAVGPHEFNPATEH